MDRDEAMLLTLRGVIEALGPDDKRTLFLGLVYPELVDGAVPPPTEEQRAMLAEFAWDVTHGDDWIESLLSLSDQLRRNRDGNLRTEDAPGAHGDHGGAS